MDLYERSEFANGLNGKQRKIISNGIDII